MTYEEYLAGVDDSHQMTTAREHIAFLCEIVAGQDGWRILELGSHAGISTAALAIAAPESMVVSVDLCDTVCEADRVAYWALLELENIQPVQADAGRFLRDCQLGLEPWDMIFHDACHGDAVLPEYLTAAGLCDTLAIHDWEQLSPTSQSAIAKRFGRTMVLEPDARGRQMFVGVK
jgi:predicted O-methyltransferase YrrM